MFEQLADRNASNLNVAQSTSCFLRNHFVLMVKIRQKYVNIFVEGAKELFPPSTHFAAMKRNSFRDQYFLQRVKKRFCPPYYFYCLLEELFPSSTHFAVPEKTPVPHQHVS